ncbi:MAG: 30S ribosomal protein S1, partial [Desulfobacterales bacterium]
MMDPVNEDNNEEIEESFAEMLDAYSPGSDAEFGIGDKIHGKIVSIGRDSVFIDTGTKIDGAVDKAELIGENGQLPFQEGDFL